MLTSGIALGCRSSGRTPSSHSTLNPGHRSCQRQEIALVGALFHVESIHTLELDLKYGPQ
jgi:hypothetical protein